MRVPFFAFESDQKREEEHQDNLDGVGRQPAVEFHLRSGLLVGREEQGPLKEAIKHLERVRDDLLAAMFPKGAK